MIVFSRDYSKEGVPKNSYDNCNKIEEISRETTPSKMT